MENNVVLTMRDISKTFPGVKALQPVSYTHLNQAAGVKTVYLRYTALPSEEQKKQMGDFIKKKYGAGDIKWVMAEDKALIGGFILQVDGKEYDYSVQGRLNRLERKLTN